MPMVKAYLRIGEAGAPSQPYMVRAHDKPINEPLKRASTYIPTCAFAIEFDIPEESFRLSEKVIAQVNLMHSTEIIAGDITYLED
jgi:hypothetical protein